MPDNLADGKGQVPPASQYPDSNGQVPPASQVSADPGSNSEHGESASEPEMTPDQYRDALKRANAQAAKYRVDSKELAELRAFKQQQEDAKLSETERNERQRAADQSRIAELETQLQEARVAAKIESAADKLGLNAELAHRILDWSAIEYGEDGKPTNVADLLAQAMAAFGLSAPTQQQQPSASQPTPAAPAMGATNPPRGSQVAGANGTFSRGEIPKLTDPRLWKR